MTDTTISGSSALLDWLTVTATARGKRDGLRALGLELVKLSADDGNDLRDWHWKGYVGSHAGQATFGVRDDSTILQLSGDYADKWFDYAYVTSDHCTRIDLAVTVGRNEGDGNLCQQHLAEILRWKAETGRTLATKTICDDDRPNTLYLGSRSSDLFARVYDKALELGGLCPGTLWRYEVEVKAEPAQRTASWLHSAGDRPARIRNAVYQHYRRRGCEPVFSCLGDPMYIRTIRASTDDASRLAWLATQVRPAVQRLLRNGHTDTLWEALGLPRSVSEQFRLFGLLERGQHNNELEGLFDEGA